MTMTKGALSLGIWDSDSENEDDHSKKLIHKYQTTQDRVSH